MALFEFKKKKCVAVNLLARIAEHNQDGEDSRISRAVIAIVSFLRGPDDNNWELKDMTTCRVRAIIGMKRATSRYMDVRENRLSDAETVRREFLLSKAPSHFSQHWHYVIEAIKLLYDYDLETETPLNTEKPANG